MRLFYFSHIFCRDDDLACKDLRLQRFLFSPPATTGRTSSLFTQLSTTSCILLSLSSTSSCPFYSIVRLDLLLETTSRTRNTIYAFSLPVFYHLEPPLILFYPPPACSHRIFCSSRRSNCPYELPGPPFCHECTLIYSESRSSCLFQLAVVRCCGCLLQYLDTLYGFAITSMPAGWPHAVF